MSGYSGEEKALLPLLRITLQLHSGPDPADIAYNVLSCTHCGKSVAITEGNKINVRMHNFSRGG